VIVQNNLEGGIWEMRTDEQHWRIVNVPAGNWVRGNDMGRTTWQSRVHLVPQSLEACQFAAADMRPENNNHMTWTGLNPSWVKVGQVWVRAYRVNVHETAAARSKATVWQYQLNQMLMDSRAKGYPVFTWLDDALV
jgi:hypothetical protein